MIYGNKHRLYHRTMHIDLAKFIGENADITTVQVYLCADEDNRKNLEDLTDIVDINIPNERANDIASAVQARFGKGSVHKTLSIHHSNMSYNYDLTNDGQKVIRQNLIKEDQQGCWYIQAVQEEVLPSHLFPCTQDVIAECETETHQYRVNNRIFVTHEISTWKSKNKITEKQEVNHAFYVTYNHKSNVDLTNMQHDLNRAVRMLADCCRFS